ncbi:MAG: amino acid adenylation domain-containing protein, partial [Acidobacteria bacterium]|nr:amino acid adenylation domain-containing protein [Acidobacteriota bacterium]
MTNNADNKVGNMNDAAKRQALLEKLLKKKLPTELKANSIPRRKVFSPAPLSFSQQRLWVLDRLVPGNTSYNVPTALQINGKIDITIFERALNEMVRRHESLRTIFGMENETPVQIILPSLSLRVNIIDLTILREEEKETRAQMFMTEEASVPFDLEHGPLLRVFLLVMNTGSDDHILIYTMHHIISDTWSMELFMKEIVTIYEAFLMGNPSHLPGPGLQYPDFAVWQREWFQGEILAKQLSYWKTVLSGELPILTMPSDRQRPPVSSYRGKTFRLSIPGEMTLQLMELNHLEGCSMFMMLLAVLNVLLYRYSGQEDILVGTPIANRKKQELETIIGFFANTLVLRNDLSGLPTFRQFLARVRNVSAAAYDNQDLPFEKLVEEIQPGRYMNYNPLFQAMLAFQNVPRGNLDMKSKNLEVKFLDLFSGSVKFDIWISLTQFDQDMAGELQYSTDLFNEDTMQRFWAHFQNLLAVIVANPDLGIHELEFLAKKEKEQLLKQFNDTHREYPIQPLHQTFAGQAARTPDYIALHGCMIAWMHDCMDVWMHDCMDAWMDGDGGEEKKRRREEEKNDCVETLRATSLHLTYLQLNHQSDRLAGLLIEKGVRADDVVAVMMERSVEMVIGLLGILKAGAAYLPIDPGLPQDRIDYMLKDSNARFLINKKFFRGSRGAVLQKSPPGNLAYIIYTSGSTGKPKGVMVPHEGISNRLQWMQETYHLTRDDRVLQKTPYSFDVSVWEFFWTLLNGGVLVMAKPGGHKDSAYLVEVINREKITTIHFVPTMLNVFLEEQDIHTIRTLKRVICSGEVLPLEYVEKFYKVFSVAVELHNLYGPTEASVDVTHWACEQAKGQHIIKEQHIIPIGKPVANTQIYILDSNDNIVPVGVYGELCIGGIQLARGYINRPELTADRFKRNVISHSSIVISKFQRNGNSSNPPNDPCLMTNDYLYNPSNLTNDQCPMTNDYLYRTGDWARWLADGNIEFLGRIDQQVKIRGFRIELGEIEANLRDHQDVSDAAVIAREGKLTAYIVPHAEKHLSHEQVTDWQNVFDDAYVGNNWPDPAFNISGWNSSYTGEPIPAAEMHIWVDQTVERILDLTPQHVMEIGCGTGLFLFRVIPYCRTYLGTDISRAGLAYIQNTLAQVKQPGWAEVQTRQCSADNFDGIEDGSLDLVILNSVVQYFPSADYLVDVLAKAAVKIKPGGHIFIGDVRNLALLKTFHTSVELVRAEPGTKKETLLRRVSDKISREQELVIHPQFFNTLEKTIPRLKHVQLLSKYGRYANELSKFRYDVILYIDDENKKWPCHYPGIILDWKQEKPGLEKIRNLVNGLIKKGNESIIIQSIPDARVSRDIQAQKQLEGIEEPVEPGFYPDDFLDMADGFPNPIFTAVPHDGFAAASRQETMKIVRVRPCLSVANIFIFAAVSPVDPGTFSVVITHHNIKNHLQIKTIEGGAYTNNPLLAKISGPFVPILREYLKERVPEYMVPNHFIMLDRLPVTANGKLDRGGLPVPFADSFPVQEDQEHDFIEPATANEVLLAQTWKEILNLERVSINHNFFKLGGDSVNAIQTVSRAHKKGLKISVQLLFKNQTIAELAAAAEKIQPIYLPFAEVNEETYREFAASLDMDEIRKQLPAGIEIEDIYPATPLQRHQAHYLETAALVDPPVFLYVRWTRPFSLTLNIELLEQILQVVSDNHPVLRTIVLWKNLAEPVQVIVKKLKFDFAYYDLTALSTTEKPPAFENILKQDWHNSFIRNNSSPMRVGMIKLTENLFQYYYTGDYMRVDGWSAHRFIEQILALYGAGTTTVPAVEHTNCYKEYLHTIRRLDEQMARDYWQVIYKNYSGPKPLASI